jgi:hypothetical protein
MESPEVVFVVSEEFQAPLHPHVYSNGHVSLLSYIFLFKILRKVGGDMRVYPWQRVEPSVEHVCSVHHLAKHAGILQGQYTHISPKM